LEIAATVGLLFSKEVEPTVVCSTSLTQGVWIAAFSFDKVFASSLGKYSLGETNVACELTISETSDSLGDE